MKKNYFNVAILISIIFPSRGVHGDAHLCLLSWETAGEHAVHSYDPPFVCMCMTVRVCPSGAYSVIPWSQAVH